MNKKRIAALAAAAWMACMPLESGMSAFRLAHAEGTADEAEREATPEPTEEPEATPTSEPTEEPEATSAPEDDDWKPHGEAWAIWETERSWTADCRIF